MDLCVRSQKYGVQDVIQDCMDREKGFYLGDGCYSVLANLILTKDDTMTRKLIDDAFDTDFISDTLVTCMDCSFIQEIAEYPLILVYLVLWHYNLTKDKDYLRTNHAKIVKLLEAYRRRYETDGLIKNIDKWCVVEWPDNFRDGYDVDISQNKVCTQAHVSINAYYIEALKVANHIAKILGEPPYRDIKELLDKFIETFYDGEAGLFRDGEDTKHISLTGNTFVYAFDLCDDDRFRTNFMDLWRRKGPDSLLFFCTFPLLMRFAMNGDTGSLKTVFESEKTWRRMLKEGATAVFEGWGKASKWNTSLFHMTLTYGAVFISDADLKELFEGM